MSTNFSGFELLLQIVKHDLNRKEDIIVCAAHWKIVASGILCTGVGSRPSSSYQDVPPTAQLPEGWNSDKEGYLLRYKKNDEIYILKALNVEDVVLLSLVRMSDGKVASISVQPDTFVSSDFKSNPNPLQKAEQLASKIQTELINPLIQDSAGIAPQGNAETVNIIQGPAPNPPPQPHRQDPLMVGGPRYPQNLPPIGNPFNDDLNPIINPFNIGRDDLHPFGNLGPGGGMLFPGPGHQPNIPQAGIPPNLPRGAVPPGARFDPIGPPNPNVPPVPGFQPPGAPGRGRGGFGGPDPDHLPPPPGYDDMFM